MSDPAEVMKNTHALKLYVMQTGSVHMSGDIHFNKKSPKFASMPKDKRFNPVLAYLVEHPDKGYVLLDTGLDASFCRNKFGNFGPLLGRVVKTKAEPGKDAVSQLKVLGLQPSDVKYVLMSHLHLDHASSLTSFARGTEVYVDADELKTANSPLGTMAGYLKNLDGVNIKPYRYGGRLGPFDRSLDFFGDGSLFILNAAGHTKGNVAVLLNAQGGPILLTFDACHRKAGLEEMIPPKGDYEKGLDSLRKIKDWLDEFPSTRTIFGHDPDQLGELKLLPAFYS